MSVKIDRWLVTAWEETWKGRGRQDEQLLFLRSFAESQPKCDAERQLSGQHTAFQRLLSDLLAFHEQLDCRLLKLVSGRQR